MIKYIRKHWALWLFGMLFPAFFSTAANIYFAKILQDYVATITIHQTSFREISKMLLLALPVFAAVFVHR